MKNYTGAKKFKVVSRIIKVNTFSNILELFSAVFENEVDLQFRKFEVSISLIS